MPAFDFESLPEEVRRKFLVAFPTITPPNELFRDIDIKRLPRLVRRAPAAPGPTAFEALVGESPIVCGYPWLVYSEMVAWPLEPRE